MTGPLRWPVAIALSSLVLSNLVLAGVHGPVRLLVTLWFLLLCTGMAFVPLFGLTDRATELALGVVTSIALDAVVTTTFVEAGGLSATAGLFVLQALALAGCALQALAWMRAPEGRRA